MRPAAAAEGLRDAAQSSPRGATGEDLEMPAEGRRPSTPQSVRTYPALDAVAGLRREYMPICGRLARRATPAVVGADRPEGS